MADLKRGPGSPLVSQEYSVPKRAHNNARARRASCRCCNSLLNCVDGFLRCLDLLWYDVKAWSRRRRNCFKLSIFFMVQAIMSLIMFVLGVTFYNVANNGLRYILPDCTISSLTDPVTDAALRTLAAQNRGAAMCDSDIDPGACTYADMRAIMDLMLVSGVVACFQMAASTILAIAFRMFANIKAEDLQHSKTTWKTTITGGICKQMPWLTRFLHLFQLVMLLILCCFIGAGTCMKELHRTLECENYESSCAYNKVRNCQYFYYNCWPSEEVSADARIDEIRDGLMDRCFSTGDEEEATVDPVSGATSTMSVTRDKFSGIVDIRHIPSSRCLRCKILHEDFQSEDMDRFTLLNETNGTAADCAGQVCCTADGACFKHSLKQDDYNDCPSLRRRLGPGGPGGAGGGVGDGWLYDRLGGLDRRLDGLGLDRHHLDGPDGLDARRRRKSGGEEGGGGDRGRDRGGGGGGRGGGGQSGGGPAPAAGEVPRVRRLVAASGSCSDSSYSFSEANCKYQSGSFVYRYGSMYSILAGSFAFFLTFAGQVLRLVAKPEPFFFQPSLPNESKVFVFLRFMGP